MKRGAASPPVSDSKPSKLYLLLCSQQRAVNNYTRCEINQTSGLDTVVRNIAVEKKRSSTDPAIVHSLVAKLSNNDQ